eukprot:PhM_4_TR5551/c0_g1_i1/m.2791
MMDIAFMVWPHDRPMPSSISVAVTPVSTTLSELYFVFHTDRCDETMSFDSSQVFQISSSTITPPSSAPIYTNIEANNGVHYLCVSTSYGRAPSAAVGATTFYSYVSGISFSKITGIDGATTVSHTHQTAKTYTLEGRYIVSTFVLRLYTDSACTTGQIGADM